MSVFGDVNAFLPPFLLLINQKEEKPSKNLPDVYSHDAYFKKSNFSEACVISFEILSPVVVVFIPRRNHQNNLQNYFHPAKHTHTLVEKKNRSTVVTIHHHWAGMN